MTTMPGQYFTPRMLVLSLAFSGMALTGSTPLSSLAFGQTSPVNRGSSSDLSGTGNTASPNQSVRLAFFSTGWNSVLNKVAKETGSTLVADRIPGGRFSRQDYRKHSRTQAVRILNEDLEPRGFRLLEKGKYLVLIELTARRAEYPRQISNQNPLNGSRPGPREPQTIPLRPSQPIAETQRFPAADRFPESDRFPGAERSRNVVRESRQQQQFGTTIRPIQGLSPHREEGPTAQGTQPRLGSMPARQSAFRSFPRPESRRPSPPKPIRRPHSTSSRLPEAGRPSGINQPRPLRNSRIQPVLFQNYDDEQSRQAAQSIRRSYMPKQRTAQDLARILRDAFSARSEVVQNGPDELPALNVYSKLQPGSTEPKQLLFSVGVNTLTNEMIVEGDRTQVERMVRLIQHLDTAPRANESTRLVSTRRNPTRVAKNLQPAIQELVARNNQNPQAPENPAAPPNPPLNPGEEPEADLSGGIRSEVNIEAMEELGVLIIRGNAADVDAVMKIIADIEELSAETAPNINLRMLEHVDGQALAELLSTVYTQLSEARGEVVARQAPDISIIPVGRPNAVLVIASTADIEAVDELIDKLDVPINPQTSFMVFPLQHAIALQVETLLEDFYARQSQTPGGVAPRTGLMTRVTIVADARTNTVIVLAQPNDLREIAKVIPQIDKATSPVVSRVQVFELRHATAEELAETLNNIIQNVINPAQLGQGALGGALLGAGGTGQTSQLLRDVRSSILEYLNVEDGELRKMRSGLIADIRISGDPRSNTIIATAPADSMELIEALVRRLDKPASAVASIKHYPLQNADAVSVQQLLTDLFTDQTAGQNTAVGVQLAGAEQASSVIPLRFSVDVRTNSIVAVGTSEALGIVEALLFRLDESDVRDQQSVIIRLKNAPAQDIADAVTAFVQSQTDLLQSAGDLISPFEYVERNVIVQPEPYTNSLLISATPRYFKQIEKMVLTLDRELPQVVIQALIVEVLLEDTDEFGIELGIQDSLLFDRGSTTTGGVTTSTPGFNFNGPAVPSANARGAGSVAGQALSNFAVGRENAALGFGGLVLSAGSESVSILLRALSQQRQLEILSRPQIRTLDNRPALIRMVREQQRVNGFQTNNVTGAFNPTVEQAEAGIILSVTPTISPDGNILISLTAEKSAFDNDTGVVLSVDPISGTPIRATVKDVTQAETTVVVADEQTIVLGGLISKSSESIQRKVPWLGDVPVIGKAFRFDSETNARTELLIFLTPRIVKGHDHNEQIKAIEADRIHFTEYNAEEIHGPIYAVPESLPMPAVPANNPTYLNEEAFDLLETPPPVPAVPMNEPGGAPMSQAAAPSQVRQATYDIPQPSRPPQKRPAPRPRAR